MPTVNFYLKKAEPKTGLSLIFMQVNYDGYRLVWSFNQTISPRHWDKDKKQAVINDETKEMGYEKLNDFLIKASNAFHKIYLTEKVKKVPKPEKVKSNLNRMLKWGCIVDKVRELSMDKSRRDKLGKAYVKQRLIRAGWPADIVEQNPILLDIKKVSILTKRILKIN